NTEKIFSKGKLIMEAQQERIMRAGLIGNNAQPSGHNLVGVEGFRVDAAQNVVGKAKFLLTDAANIFANFLHRKVEVEEFGAVGKRNANGRANAQVERIAESRQGVVPVAVAFDALDEHFPKGLARVLWVCHFSLPKWQRQPAR